MRVYECLAAGCFQLVDSNPYIEETFSDGLVTYTNEQDMYEKLDFYLAYDTERDEITQKGYECVTQNHLFANRMKAVNEVTNNDK